MSPSSMRVSGLVQRRCLPSRAGKHTHDSLVFDIDSHIKPERQLHEQEKTEGDLDEFTSQKGSLEIMIMKPPS